MSDQTDIDMNTGDAGVSEGASKRGRGILGLLLKVLKWVAICAAALIFIVTVVVITVRIMGRRGQSATAVLVSEDYVALQEPLDWFQGVGSIQTRSSDVLPASVIVEVALGYTQGDRNSMTELSARLVELRDFLRSFFRGKTALELAPENEARLKIEIRNYVNDNILTRTRIRDVRFTRFDVVEQ